MVAIRQCDYSFNPGFAGKLKPDFGGELLVQDVLTALGVSEADVLSVRTLA